MHYFQKFIVVFLPPSPCRNKDMEISCASAGANRLSPLVFKLSAGTTVYGSHWD